MTVRILIDRAMPPLLTEYIDTTLPDWATCRDLDRTDPEFDAVRAAANVWLHVLDPIDADDIAAAPELRLIHKMGAGVNTIDRVAAAAADLAVANMPGANAPAVAEHTVALMLAVFRRLPAQHAGTVAGTAWPGGPTAPAPSAELSGMRVGLIGRGEIGTRVERALTAFGATVAHHTRRDDGEGWLPLDELLATSDAISLHLPLTDDTQHLLNADRIGRMRQGTVIINTARGGLIDQAALHTALADGHLGGAGLDVFDPEPPPADDPILGLPNVVATPHSAWLTVGTLRRCWDRGLANCRRLQDGEPFDDIVDAP